MKRPHYKESIVLERSDHFLTCAREDEADLTSFGISKEFLNDFQARKEYAESLPDWEGQLMEIKDETGKKNTVLADCFEWGKDFRAKLEIRYGKSSRQMKRFPSSSFNVADRSERRMISVMKNLLRMAKSLQPEMMEVGVTDEFITGGQSLLDLLRTANLSQEDQKSDSKEITRDRYGIFSNLIEDCNKIRTAGKRVYKDNPSKLSRYDVKWTS
jgi:hypothetical protein